MVHSERGPQGPRPWGQVPGDAELILMPERRCFIAD